MISVLELLELFVEYQCKEVARYTHMQTQTGFNAEERWE